MAIGKGIVGNARTQMKPKQQDDARVKAGLEKFREAMMADAKALSARDLGLPKDARERLIR